LLKVVSKKLNLPALIYKKIRILCRKFMLKNL